MELFHVSHGAGLPVIALHGYSATHYSWRHLIEAVARERELILFDLKGHGRSPKPENGKYSLRDQAELVHDYIRARDLKGITLIGHSMGGGVALILASRLLAERPDRLKALVHVAGVSFPQPLAIFARLARIPYVGEAGLSLLPAKLVVRASLYVAFHDRRRITEDMVEAYAANFADRAGIRAIIAITPHVVPPNIEPVLDAIDAAKIPVLLLWGSHDAVVPLKLGRRLHARLKNSRLHVIENCGHIPHEETPERAVPVIAEFVACGGFPPA